MFREGRSARQVARDCQIALGTAFRYRDAGGVLFCACGKQINHVGFCAPRISFSPNRLAYLAKCAAISAANISISAIAREPFLLVWPYVRDLDNADNQLLRAVNDILPRTLPEQIRADVGQELLLAVLDGQFGIAELPLHVSLFTKRIWAQQQSRFSESSIDAPLGESRHTLADRLIG